LSYPKQLASLSIEEVKIGAGWASHAYMFIASLLVRCRYHVICRKDLEAVCRCRYPPQARSFLSLKTKTD
jgi:hypothetical protein